METKHASHAPALRTGPPPEAATGLSRHAGTPAPKGVLGGREVQALPGPACPSSSSLSAGASWETSATPPARALALESKASSAAVEETDEAADSCAGMDWADATHGETVLIAVPHGAARKAAFVDQDCGLVFAGAGQAHDALFSTGFANCVAVVLAGAGVSAMAHSSLPPEDLAEQVRHLQDRFEAVTGARPVATSLYQFETGLREMLPIDLMMDPDGFLEQWGEEIAAGAELPGGQDPEASEDDNLVNAVVAQLRRAVALAAHDCGATRVDAVGSWLGIDGRGRLLALPSEPDYRPVPGMLKPGPSDE